MEIKLIPVRYELDRIPASINCTNSIFVHNKFGLNTRFFPLIKGEYISSVNLPLEVLSVSFSYDLVSVEILDSCVVLRFPCWC